MKIAILGTTPSRALAPLQDESWEKWTIGPGGKDAHHWDRLFELHTTWPENFKGYLNDLSQVKKPQIIHTIVPMKEQMVEWAHGHDKDEDWLKENIKGKWSSNVVIDRNKFFERYPPEWFSSSISYCVALAMEAGADEIGLWGIDLESGEEYIAQKFGCRALIWAAQKKGIKFTFPPGCGLEAAPKPYPDRYETHQALMFEKKVNWLDELVAQNEPQYEAIKTETYRTEGRLITLRDIKALPFPVHDEFKQWVDKLEGETQNHLNGMVRECKKAADSIAHLKGERAATQFWRRIYVWGMTEPDE